MGRFYKPNLIFLFFGVLLFWPILLGKVNLNGNLLVSFYAPWQENLPFKNIGWDQLRIYFPFHNVTFTSFKSGNFALWNPYAFSGHPNAADFQTAVFYPLNIFGLFLSQIEFWHFLRLTPAILGAYFTYIFLSNLKFLGKKLSKISAFFGAVTFGFSPFILTWGEEVVMAPHSVVWLPLVLWGLDKYLEVSSSRHPKSSEGPVLSKIRFWTSQNDKRGRGQNDGKKYLAVIAAGSAFSFLAGYMQTTIYLFIFVFSYLIFRIWPIKAKNFSSITALGSAFLLGTALAAVQILPSAEIFFNAARAEITLTETLFTFLLPLESVVTFLVPDFFGHPATGNFFRRGAAQYYEGILFVGAAAVLFASYAVFRKTKEKLVPFLGIFFLVSASTTFDLPSSKLFLSLPVPFLSTSIANRILFIPAFCLATLAAFGLEQWLGTKDRKILKTAGVFAGIYFLLGFALLVFKVFGLSYFEHSGFKSEVNLMVSLRNLVIPGIVFGFTFFAILASERGFLAKKTAAFLIIAFAMLQTFYFSQKYFSFTLPRYVFPKTEELAYILKNQEQSRFWGLGKAHMETNFASQFGLYSPEGYDSLNNRRYSEFTYGMQGANLDHFVSRADAGLGGEGEAAAILENPDRRKLMNLLGVKSVLVARDDEDVAEKNGLVKVFDTKKGEYSVFDNSQALPRFILASGYEMAGSSKKETIERLLSSDFDLANKVLLEEKPAVEPEEGGRAQVEVGKYALEEAVLKIRAEKPKILLVSDNYYPGWRVNVDGKEAKLLRADYTLRGVALPAGEHEVKFYFAPMSFKLGAIISLASLVVLAFFLKIRLLKFLR